MQLLQATPVQTTSTTDVMAAHDMALGHKGTKIGEPSMHSNDDCDIDTLFSDAMLADQNVGILEDTMPTDTTPTLYRVVAQHGMHDDLAIGHHG
jgi:hypothetical protein